MNKRLLISALAGLLIGGGIFSTYRAVASGTMEDDIANACAQTCNGLPAYEKQVCLAACQNSGSGPSCKDVVGSSETACLSCCQNGIGVDGNGNQIGGCIEAQPSTPSTHAAWEACVQGCRAGCSGKKPSPLPTPGTVIE